MRKYFDTHDEEKSETPVGNTLAETMAERRLWPSRSMNIYDSRIKPTRSMLNVGCWNGGTGVGIVIDRQFGLWGEAYGLTAAHVIRDAKSVAVSSLGSDEPTKLAAVISADAERDLALLHLPAGLECSVIPVCPSIWLPIGEPCVCMSKMNDRPIVINARTTETREYKSVPRGVCLLTDITGFRGKSGSPLIARHTCIGVCYGHRLKDGKTIYVSLKEIHPFLREAGFSWLLEIERRC